MLNRATPQQNCNDYGDGYSTSDVMAFCSSTYTATACPSAGRKGHCIFVEKGSGTPQTLRVSYYDVFNSSDCTLNMGTPFPN